MAPKKDQLVFTPARFLIGLALLLSLVFWKVKPDHSGDFAEYSAMTVAIAAHGTPAIRPADMAETASLAPNLLATERQFAQGAAARVYNPAPQFYRGSDGQYYALHFFAYSALAALPFKLFKAVGIAPFKCFQAVNLAFVFLLGVACLRLFGTVVRAALALLLFMLSGGIPYLQWSSPELMSAAGLLCALIFFITEAPLLAGGFAGLAAMQNPAIIFFVGFAPLLKFALERARGMPWRDAARSLVRARILLSLALAAGLSLTPSLFSLWQFKMPSLIAKEGTDIHLMSMQRLASFFFDLNQGMLIGVPALFLFLLAGLVWRPQRGDRLLLLIAAGASIALAVPALSAYNWNSGASGMMRYAFWASMPVLFALLLCLSRAPAWPRLLMAGVLAIQCLSTWQALAYSHLQFSPTARWVMNYAPALYNPEPEVFVERLHQREEPIDPGQPYTYGTPALPRKTLYKLDNGHAIGMLCGPAAYISPANRIVEVGHGWGYINGRVACDQALGNSRSIAVEQFPGEGVQLLAGWSRPEFGGGAWSGVWSDGAESSLTVKLDPALAYRQLTISGHYFGNGARTRVMVNGEDTGWQRLQEDRPIALKVSHAGELTISLQHDPGTLAPATATDHRQLAFFLQKIVLD